MTTEQHPEKSLEVLGDDECLRLLGEAVIGRVGFQADGILHVLPVNYAVDADGTVVFRTTVDGVLARLAGRQAVFEVDGFDIASRTGWSVCVRGMGRDIAAARFRAVQHLLDLPVIPWAPGQRDRWFAITPDEVSGRRIPIVRAADFGWIPGVVS
jgi:nitroimidazol reductase NimA-like FMN-containing flavoprotein (pyridoxamine 5'-phosphate oxidase superfamily)